MNRYECKVETADPLRVDRYTAEALACQGVQMGRSRLKACIARYFINNREVKSSFPVSSGDMLVVEWKDEVKQVFEAERIDLAVLFENDQVIVVDKPQGMVTHPAHGNWTGTLANALLGRMEGEKDRKDAQDNGLLPLRAGIVHRLDKDTSGVIICAKTSGAQDCLAGQFRKRSSHKEYLAIVRGRMPAHEGCIENRLARDPHDRKRFAVVQGENSQGKLAKTYWKVRASYGSYSLLSLKPETGRTHQLRVHLSFLSCPILGDPIYGRPDKQFPTATLMLHSWKLTIKLPGLQEASTFRSPIPVRFKVLIAYLKKNTKPPSPAEGRGLRD